MQNLNDKLQQHEFSAELVSDKYGDAIMLTQAESSYDEPCSVLLHPWQLRAVCENFGLLTADSEAHKTIAMLTRRLLTMCDRTNHLADWLANNSDSKHADLTYEQTYARASADIGDEFSFELGAVASSAAPANPAEKQVVRATGKTPQGSLI
jgi:hypothetical protein